MSVAVEERYEAGMDVSPVMERPRVSRIAIGGGFGSGKTTAARYLVEEHGFKILGFATPLYELAELHRMPRVRWPEEIARWTAQNLTAIFTPLQLDAFAWWSLEAFCAIPVEEGKNRTLLQRLGTEVGRGIDPDLWTKLFARRVRALGPDAKIVNDNLRFVNELECCRDLGFKTLFLDIPPALAAVRYEREYGRGATPEQQAHASEAELGDVRLMCERVYNNSRARDWLYRALDDLVLSGDLQEGTTTLS